MITDPETQLCALSPAELRAALITRADAVTHDRGNDVENTRWLACVVAVFGWPDRHLVQDDGALAALLLAGRAPIEYQATWRPKLVIAIRTGAVDTQTAGALLESIAAKRGTAA